MKAHVFCEIQIILCHRQGLGTGVEQMQVLDPRRDVDRPAARSVTDIDPDAAARGKLTPGKNPEIVVEDLSALIARQAAFVLPESRPLLAEAAGDLRVQIIVRVIAQWNYLKNRENLASFCNSSAFDTQSKVVVSFL